MAGTSGHLMLAEPLLQPKRETRRCFNGGLFYGVSAMLAISFVALTVLSASSGKSSRSAAAATAADNLIFSPSETIVAPAGLLPTEAAIAVPKGKAPEFESCAKGFASDFVWGLGTAAYQIEGGASLMGREPSIWDTFSHIPGKIADGSTGDVACDHIHLWPQDVELMSSIGLKHYRLSISWSRVMSWDADAKKMVENEEGMAFYRQLLEALKKKGITAYVTLYHWDLPQTLHDELGGWHTPDNEPVLAEFDAYARLCFKRLGHLVAIWMTFNEPWTFTVGGYSAGNHAPGCAPYQASELPCHNGDTAPYIVAHNVLNAHARASAIYRAEFQHAQGGKVSITYPCEISTGLTGSEADASAAEVANEFFLGWWLQPLVSGDYPAAMRDRVGDRLPRFSAAQSASLRKSIDVLSLNHYSTHLVSATAAGDVGDTSSGWMADQRIRSTFGKDWPASASSWQHAYPPGIRMLLRWASKRWKGPIFITENGWSCNSMSQEEAMHDTQQLDYFQNYTEQVRLAITHDGIDVRGYFGWSLMDNYEWADGYSKRFGLFYVDYKTQARIPKLAARWWNATRKACHK